MKKTLLFLLILSAPFVVAMGLQTIDIPDEKTLQSKFHSIHRDAFIEELDGLNEFVKETKIFSSLAGKKKRIVDVFVELENAIDDYNRIVDRKALLNLAFKHYRKTIVQMKKQLIINALLNEDKKALFAFQLIEKFKDTNPARFEEWRKKQFAIDQ